MRTEAFELVGLVNIASESISHPQINPTGGGDSGSITIVAEDTFRMKNGATVSTGTRVAGDAGSIRVHAGKVEIDGNGRATGWAANR